MASCFLYKRRDFITLLGGAAERVRSSRRSENFAAQCEVLHISKVGLDGIINEFRRGRRHTFQFALRAVLALR
jgi:hypothetical protein